MPLYDPRTGEWDERYAEHVAPSSMLPAPGWSDEVAGAVTRAGAAATGLAVGTPVAVGAVDALSEAISVGVVRPGDLMIMYGSTTFFILVQSQPTPDERMWTVAGAYPGQFNLAAGMSTTGSLTRWFQDQLARDLPEGDAGALFAAAARVTPGAGGLVCLPYFSGERTPLNDPMARGVIAGLSLSAHARARLSGHSRRRRLRRTAQPRNAGAARRARRARRRRRRRCADRHLAADRLRRVRAAPGGAHDHAGSLLRRCVPCRLRGRPAAARADTEWVRPGRGIEPDVALRPTYDALYRGLPRSVPRLPTRRPSPRARDASMGRR